MRCYKLFLSLIFLPLAIGFFQSCSNVDSNLERVDVEHEYVDTVQVLAQLGEQLFFDARLSSDESISCASCHIPELAFADHEVFSQGVYDSIAFRHTPSILNVHRAQTLMADAHITELEMQLLVPLTDHSEMGMEMGELIEKLQSIPEYERVATDNFGITFNPWLLTRSIAAFERTLISMDSKYDKVQRGDLQFTDEEARGAVLFLNKLHCAKCHPAPDFTTYKAENNGIRADYSVDAGRFRIHGDSSDYGKFKVPSLRNVEITHPYMHNGSMQSLDEVIDHYIYGRHNHINTSDLIVPLQLNEQDRGDLKAFLKTLTDTTYMVDFR